MSAANSSLTSLLIRLFLLGVTILLQLLTRSAHAATFTVTNTNDSGTGSLRQAIATANGAAGADIIAFDIPGNGPFTINVLTPLPTLSSAITVDGYTQPGAIANTLSEGDNAIILIRLDGVSAGASTSGLAVCSGSVVIRGLSITRFQQHAIVVGGDSAGSVCASPPSGAVVEGNFLGLDSDGSTIFGNRFIGIVVTAAPNTRIGGITPGSRNIIAGNGTFGSGTSISGIGVVGASSVGTVIDGNYIGTDRSGVLDRGNQGPGVFLNTGASGVLIGSVLANRIAFNREGIAVIDTAAGNTFFANDIGPNDNLGIDLCSLASPCPDGTTSNDFNDVDVGGNDLQNFPVLTDVTRTVGGVQLVGTLDRVSTLGPRTYTIAAYASPGCDVSGNGEGAQFLGSADFVSTGPAIQSFNINIANAAALPVGSFITATATDLSTNNTSEFSACQLLDNAVAITVTNTLDSGAGSLRQAIIDANAAAGGDTIAFNIPGSGVKTIVPLTALPAISEALVIDGYSQPGSFANFSASASNAVILIEINANASSALQIGAANVTVRGLAVFGSNSRGIQISGANSNVVVEGCFIGVRADGASGAGSSVFGIDILGGTGHRIGGTLPAQRNLISTNGGNIGGGIRVANSTSSDIDIDGNLIGTDRTGTQALGNFVGIAVSNSAADVRIGVNAPNLIRFNDQGVAVNAGSTGVTAYANDISNNFGLGIDLSASPNLLDGVTPNDLNDADAGGNTLQNFPVLSSASLLSNSLSFSGRLDVPIFSGGSATLAFYASATCDANGNGEGAAFLGSVDRNILQGSETFSVTLPGVAPIGSKITSTSTIDGNTSEFSVCVNLVDGNLIFANGFE